MANPALPPALGSREAEVTVYISIGNSDDKLTQREWASFVGEVDSSVRWHSQGTVHGFWLSPSNVPWQNACWCVEYEFAGDEDTWTEQAEEQKVWLQRLAAKYRQDSIAWAVAETEFLRGTDG